MGTIFRQGFATSNEYKKFFKVWSLKYIPLLRIYKSRAFETSEEHIRRGFKGRYHSVFYLVDLKFDNSIS